MGSINYNCFSINSLCDGKNDVWNSEKYVKRYEDTHVRLESEHIIEKCNGKIKRETKNISIYNKDNYYNPKEAISSGNKLLLGN